MVEKKNLEKDVAVQTADADEGTAPVKLTKTEDEEPTITEARSLKKEEVESSLTKGRTHAEKVFNDFLSTIRSGQEDFTKAISDYTTNVDKPLADVVETDEEIIIKTDLPGVKKEDIEVNLTETTVEITAKFQEEYSAEDVDYILRERNFGETIKVIQLPAKIKVKDVTAKFEDSVLSINLPKVEGEKIIVDIN